MYVYEIGKFGMAFKCSHVQSLRIACALVLGTEHKAHFNVTFMKKIKMMYYILFCFTNPCGIKYHKIMGTD